MKIPVIILAACCALGHGQTTFQGVTVQGITVQEGTAQTPIFSPAAGGVSNPTTITASTGTAGCSGSIYFDASNPPTTNQTTYSVTTAVTLYADVHGCSGFKDSGIASAPYTISVSPPAFVTGQDCTGGRTTSGASTTCSAPITVSTGDEIVVGGNNAGNITLTSCSSASGTATVTWSNVTSASNVNDPANGETNGTCVGHVTAGGTVEPEITFSTSGGDGSIVAADFSGSNNTTDGATAQLNAGSTSTNGASSGNITTTINSDALIGVVVDTVGAAAAITAGTASVTFTKIVCTTAWGGQTCIEWGTQVTAGTLTHAAWTFNIADINIASVVALQP